MRTARTEGPAPDTIGGRAKTQSGHVTRKRKLPDKQKAGKKKIRQFGRVEIPQEAFISALKMDGKAVREM